MKKITICIVVMLLISVIGHQNIAVALTPPKTDYPIKIEYVSINGVKDDNVSKEMINFAIGNLSPDKTVSLEIKISGDLSNLSHLRLLYGRNDSASLINSDEVLIHKLELTSTSDGTMLIKTDIKIPNASKGCWIKFWPIIISKDAKIIGGANTRPWSLCKRFYTPQISTGEATDITYQSATLNGNMWNVGNAPPNYVWFAIRKDGEDYDTKQMLGFNQFEKRDSFSYQIEEGLLPNQLYYFKAIAGNVAGIVYASERSFKTLPAPPKVETLPATEVNMKEWVSSWEEVNAKLNLKVTDHGNADYLDIGWYWYDKHEKPQVIHKTEPVRVFGPFEKGQKIPLSKKFYFPDSSSTYIVTAYAINEKEIEGNGESIYFPSPYPPLPIEIETMSKKDDNQYNQVTLYANLKSMGINGPCEVWFDYCQEDMNYYGRPAEEWKESKHIIVNQAGEYSITINELPSDKGNRYPFGTGLVEVEELVDQKILVNTPFWVYRAHVKNIFGQEDIDFPQKKYGEEYAHYNIFGTKFHPMFPIIRGLPTTNIMATSADLNIALLWTGYDTQITYWAEYQKKGNIGSKIQTMQILYNHDDYNSYYMNPNTGGANLPNIHIEKLEPLSTYIVKFFAINNGKKIYESKKIIEFSTKWGKKDTEYTGPIIKTIGYKEPCSGNLIMQGKLIEPGKSEWIKVWLEYGPITTWTDGDHRYYSWSQAIQELEIIQNISDIKFPDFSYQVSGILTNQKFGFRYVAENNVGQRDYGDFITLTSKERDGQAVKPELSLKIIQITPTTLLVDGYLKSIGKNIDGKINSLDIWFEAGHVIGPSFNEHMLKEFKSKIWQDINEPKKFSWYLTGLDPGVKYGVQFYGNDRTVWSVEDGLYYTEFSTPIIPPEFRANKAEYITDTKALLNADISYLSSSGTCEFWIEWGKAKYGELGGCDFENKMPFKKFRTEGSIVGDTIPKGFSWEANNLEPDTYYVYRIISKPLVYKPGKGYVKPTGSQGDYPSNEYVFKTKSAP